MESTEMRIRVYSSLLSEVKEDVSAVDGRKSSQGKSVRLFFCGSSPNTLRMRGFSVV